MSILVLTYSRKIPFVFSQDPREIVLNLWRRDRTLVLSDKAAPSYGGDPIIFSELEDAILGGFRCSSNKEKREGWDKMESLLFACCDDSTGDDLNERLLVLLKILRFLRDARLKGEMEINSRGIHRRIKNNPSTSFYRRLYVLVKRLGKRMRGPTGGVYRDRRSPCLAVQASGPPISLAAWPFGLLRSPHLMSPC